MVTYITLFSYKYFMAGELIHFFPFKEGKLIAYFPLKDSICAIEEKDKHLFLQSGQAALASAFGVSSDKTDLASLFKPGQPAEMKANITEYSPQQIFIYPTLKCNLNCIYCYNDSMPEKPSLSLEEAKKGIDFVFGKIKEAGKKTARVVLLGGGEPTLNWPVFKGSVEYAKDLAKKMGLKPKEKFTIQFA